MADNKITLPGEQPGNKQIHTREITVSGPGVVQQEYLIPTSARVVSGVYLATTGVRVVTVTADTFPAGSWWLINPVGSAVKVALRSVTFSSQIASALAVPTSPRFSLVAFTFTGTASGAQITPRKAATTFAAATATLRTANTGMTITRTQDVYNFLPVAVATAVGGVAPQEQPVQPPEDEQVVLAAGEGVVLTQATAGTTSDTRRTMASMVWAEYTVP